MVAQEILGLFENHGDCEYGEGFSIRSHSIQSGLIAISLELDEELVVAAYLHDIGHLGPLDAQEKYELMGEYGIDDHDLWGGSFLRSRGFSERIVAVVENHVLAKRYMCTTDEDYYENLSEASRKTLEFQGGKMNKEEIEFFESDDFFKESVLIRKIDDMAKNPEFKVGRNHIKELKIRIDKLMGIKVTPY